VADQAVGQAHLGGDTVQEAGLFGGAGRGQDVAQEDQGAALGHGGEAALGELVPFGGRDRPRDDRQDLLLFGVEMLTQASGQLRERVSQAAGVAGAGRALPGRPDGFDPPQDLGEGGVLGFHPDH
jgi:hypothetical protein